MGAVRVRVQLGPQPGGGILGMVGYSVGGHVIFLILTVFLPRVIPRDPPPPLLMTASIVSAGEVGLAGGAPPAPARARSGPTPEERAEAAARKERAPEEQPREESPPKPKSETPKPPPSVEKAPVKKADPKTPPPPGEKAVKHEEEPEGPAPPSGGSAPGKPAAPEPAAPLAEGVGLGSGGGDAGAGVPSITSVSFPYQYYRAALINKIRSSWSRPLTPGLSEALRCAVAFVISRDGTVSDVAVSVSSGFPPLDDSAARAVLKSSPLPPLPYQYSSSSVRAEMIFELTPD